jgi:hypothetical protein
MPDDFSSQGQGAAQSSGETLLLLGVSLAVLLMGLVVAFKYKK